MHWSKVLFTRKTHFVGGSLHWGPATTALVTLERLSVVRRDREGVGVGVGNGAGTDGVPGPSGRPPFGGFGLVGLPEGTELGRGEAEAKGSGARLSHISEMKVIFA